MDLNVIAAMKERRGRPRPRPLRRHHGDPPPPAQDRARGHGPKTLKGGKPVAAAARHRAGIGFEIGLACHRFIAADNPKARVGLPEILVGIFPGAGGTTRLVRKLGVMAAAPFLLEGKLSPRRRQGRGPHRRGGARRRAAGQGQGLGPRRPTDADIVKPWDRKGYKMPGGTPYHPAGFMTFVGASAMVHGQTQGVYPAAKAMLSAVYEGALVPFDTALRIEARWFTNVLMNPSSAAMIRSLFLNKQALEKGAARPAQPDQNVEGSACSAPG